MKTEEFDDTETTIDPDDEEGTYNGIDMLYQEWAEEDRLDPSKFVQRGSRTIFPEEFYFDDEGE